jgi:hypothetical protein
LDRDAETAECWEERGFVAAGDEAVDALVDGWEDIVVGFGVVVAFFYFFSGEI